jgi:hypothetical protein
VGFQTFLPPVRNNTVSGLFLGLERKTRESLITQFQTMDRDMKAEVGVLIKGEEVVKSRQSKDVILIPILASSRHLTKGMTVA